MNYTEIVDMGLSFADREDAEVTTRVDKFLRMVESRINRVLKVSDMSARATIDLTLTTTDQRYFALPADYGGLRSIKYVNGLNEMPLKTINPEQMTNRVNSQANGLQGQQLYYNLVAKQIQMFPPKNEGNLEITYYQRIVPLTSTEANNWISDDNPDCYINGLVAEISAFVKDGDAFAIWDKRFLSSVDDIEFDDSQNRWSGTSMEVKVG